MFALAELPLPDWSLWAWSVQAALPHSLVQPLLPFLGGQPFYGPSF